MTATSSPTTVNAEQLRTLSVVARLYHVQGIRQREIADRLAIDGPHGERVVSLREAEQCPRR